MPGAWCGTRKGAEIAMPAQPATVWMKIGMGGM
jgi:hypothetical protein